MDTRHLFRQIIGAFAVLGGIVIIALLFFVEVPNGNKDALLPLAGIVIGWGGAVVAYEFGSSSGSARKTEIMGGTK